jgi:hypothetical protein
MPGKGFLPLLRLYSPLEPFFTKEWRPSEVELVSQSGGRLCNRIELPQVCEGRFGSRATFELRPLFVCSTLTLLTEPRTGGLCQHRPLRPLLKARETGITINHELPVGRAEVL